MKSTCYIVKFTEPWYVAAVSALAEKRNWGAPYMCGNPGLMYVLRESTVTWGLVDSLPKADEIKVLSPNEFLQKINDGPAVAFPPRLESSLTLPTARFTRDFNGSVVMTQQGGKTLLFLRKHVQEIIQVLANNPVQIADVNFMFNCPDAWIQFGDSGPVTLLSSSDRANLIEWLREDPNLWHPDEDSEQYSEGN